jgi:hypothetical protein
MAALGLAAACAAPGRGGGATPAAVPRASSSTGAQGSSHRAGQLARAAQNPVADLTSFPLQSNTNFGFEPDDDTQYVLNLQPVVPFELGDGWNLITRTVFPIVSQPVPGESGVFGLGDTTFTGFFSPRPSGSFVWGVGPVFLVPTATDGKLGAKDWGAGASVVALNISGPWVAGGLVNNVWSIGNDEVNELLLQPFVNYNLKGGWYIVSAPILRADWNADSDQRWEIPVGGGVGRVFQPGLVPLNLSAQFYDFVEHPADASWQLRIQLQLLFPKG